VEALLAELSEILRARGERARVEILGHTDTDGTDLANGPLSQARADWILERIRPPLLDTIEFATRGVGSTEPLTRDTAEAEKRRNRRASFRVLLPAPSVQGSPRP
jgi:outer membrane protein OmpA-like peptidoglycan-associated protein